MAGHRANRFLRPDSNWLIRASLLPLLVVLVSGGMTLAGEKEKARDYKSSKVALFSQPFCPGCEAVKQYFGESEVAYVEFDISSSAKARDAFERLGGRGTPFLLIDGKRVHGFSVPVIEQQLLESGLLEENQ